VLAPIASFAPVATPPPGETPEPAPIQTTAPPRIAAHGYLQGSSDAPEHTPLIAHIIELDTEPEAEPEDPPCCSWEHIDAIPLDPEYQHYIYKASQRHGVQMSLVLGIIERESTFRPFVWDPTETCFGLMQIHTINHGWLLEDEGIDALTYPGNIDAGVLMISQLIEKYGDLHRALMAYNHGEAGARRLWRDGILTTRYSRNVLAAAERWEGVLNPDHE
jgi:hypothetical protein